jgi:RCC1 and BTB domain-containing protein
MSEYDQGIDDDIKEISAKIIAKHAFVWGFGENKNGELGIGNLKDGILPRPIAATLRDGQSARSISSGGHHSAIVSKTGELYVCGSHLHGKLGVANKGIINLTKFTALNLRIRAKEVACGDYHTMCLTEDGKVYAWGGTLHNKTGDGKDAANKSGLKSEPRLVQTLADKAAFIV